MNPRVSGLSGLYRLNTQIFRMTLADLDDAQVRQQPIPGQNCPLWIAGHVVGSRSHLLRLAGAPYDYPHGDFFGRGAPKHDSAVLPPLDEIMGHWKQVSDGVKTRLAELDDAALDADTGEKFPGGDGSLLGALSFLAMHESYHLGQLGYLRTAQGQKGIAG